MRFLLFILLTSLSFSEIFHVPSEYPTIQEGIDVAQNGDTVLVDQGIYNENLKITRSITLASNALFDELSDWNWVDDSNGPWQVSNTNIDSTRIDGITATDDFGSTILIYQEDDVCITPRIFGFTIQNGLGTYVQRPDEEELIRLGGGILFDVSNPTIEYNQFLSNGSTSVREGGAIYGTTEDEDWAFDNIPTNYFDSENNTMRCDIEEFNFTNNLYNDNEAMYGNDFANNGFENEFDMSKSIFEIANCGVGEISAVYVYVEPEAEVDLTDIESNLCATTATDVYVNPNINQECIENGCGLDWGNPFKTITWTLQMIMPSEDNIVTIHLADGIYSPFTNGETFPIIIMDYINIEGIDEELTILDAYNTNKVIIMENCENNILSKFTITGGIGGGIYLYYSSPTMVNIIINGNNGYGSDGGGMFLSYSNPSLLNVIISDNTTYYDGGGMFLSYSNPTLLNVIISNNVANGWSGGMYLYYSSPTITNSIIWGNIGEMYAQGSIPNINYSNIEGDENGYCFPDNMCGTANQSECLEFIELGWCSEWIITNPTNLNTDPMFTDPENGDFTLQNDSPCIDTGNPNSWYQDFDGSNADMGFTGGSLILPNFTEYNFGEIGENTSTIYFTFQNFRDTEIIIDSVSFLTESFTADTNFPLTIHPLETGIITIDCNPQELGPIEDSMTLNSTNLPDDLMVSLSAIGSEGNTLNGDLSGALLSETYRITGDINVISGDELILSEGTEFLFDGPYEFRVEGILKAQGTQQDSIIFDNYDNEHWKGFIFENVTNETTLEYVRISGAHKFDDGGGLYLLHSNPLITHTTISENKAFLNQQGNGGSGGGIFLEYSDPIMNHVLIVRNYAHLLFGGAIHFKHSEAHLNHLTIIGEITLEDTDVIITNTIIDGNVITLSNDYPNIHYTNINYSNILGGWNNGEGNIVLDPLFSDPENGDYTLQANSPCIDTGTAYYEIDGEIILDIDESEYSGMAPDMGAFEWKIEIGDLNADGILNVIDIVAMVNIIIDSTYDSIADMNSDDTVDILDIVALINIIFDN